MKANANVLEPPLAASPYKTFSLRMRVELWAALNAEARKMSMTRTSVIILAINEWLERMSPRNH